MATHMSKTDITPVMNLQAACDCVLESDVNGLTWTTPRLSSAALAVVAWAGTIGGPSAVPVARRAVDAALEDVEDAYRHVAAIFREVNGGLEYELAFRDMDAALGAVRYVANVLSYQHTKWRRTVENARRPAEDEAA